MTLGARAVRRWIAAAVLKSWWITEVNHGVISGPTAWEWHKELLDRLGAGDDGLFKEALGVGDTERRELAGLCADGASLDVLSSWCALHVSATNRVWDSLMMISGPPEALFVLARQLPVSAAVPRPLGGVPDMVRGADETWRHTATVLAREHPQLSCEEVVALVNSVVETPVRAPVPAEEG